MDIINLFRRILALFLALFASFGSAKLEPVPVAEPDRPFLFETEEEYENYYLYCTEEDPEPYSWSPEALAARDNVERQCSSGPFRVTLFKNNTARIDCLTKPVETIEIPSSVEGCRVTAIYCILPENDYDAADKIISKAKKAVIPDTVEFIMYDAFEDLANLRSVEFGGRVRFMQAYAFRDCTLLGSAALPDSLVNVPVCAFEGCTALTDVAFGKSTRIIDGYAFEYCSGLKKVVLPDSVKEIGKHSFAACARLSYIYIPASVTTIDEDAFLASRRLTIHGEKGSYAQTFAAEQGIPFAAD